MARRHTYLTRLLALLLVGTLLPSAAAMAAGNEETAPTAAIYTTSNMFGNVYVKDPLTNQAETTSYLKVATAMVQERELRDDALLLDAGNAVFAGLTGDDGQTVALALRSIGYDALIPGIEEFRLGAGYCQDFLQTLSAAEGEGSSVDVLSGNLLDNRGNLLTTPYQVYDLMLGDTAVRVGVLGLGGIDAAQQLPDYLYGSIQFAHTDNEEASYLWEWNYWRPRMEQEDCDLMVVVCHADQEELSQFAANTSGIDLLVGGDGPASDDQIVNADGEMVSYVCGGGTSLTRTLITLDEKGAPIVSGSSLLELENYENDQALSRAVSDSYTAAKEAGTQQVGALSGTWEDCISYTRQTDTVDLVGEAVLWATDADAVLISPSSLGQMTIASLFEKKSSIAKLTLSDCARLAPDLSPVVTVEMTGAQLRQWLDTCASRYEINSDGQPAGGKDADVLYGMDYSLYLSSEKGKRAGLILYEGQPVTDSQVLTIALSASRLSDSEFPRCKILWSASTQREFASQGGNAAALLAAYARNALQQGRTLEAARSSSWFIYPEAYDSPLTRLEFVEMLHVLAGRPQPGANYAFIDVADSDAVIWAAETRVVSGDGRGKFLPLTVVTREQAAVMIYNYVCSLELEIPQPADAIDQMLDAASISSWARPAVEFCLTTGILPAAGSREDLYLPTASLTRSEASLYLTNLQNYLT